MKIIDFSDCPYSDKHGVYGGLSGRKDGIVYDRDNWIIKYPKSVCPGGYDLNNEFEFKEYNCSSRYVNLILVPQNENSSFPKNSL